MTDEQTLLAAILARPLDDQMRLGYADFLDETAGMARCPNCSIVPKDQMAILPAFMCHWCHGTGGVSNGHAERAEFIRGQCELARTLEPAEISDGIDLDRDEARRHACTECRKLNRGVYCKYHTLRRREREILFDHGFKWGREAVPVPAGYKHTRHDDNDFHVWSNENLDGMQYSFRRGFVEFLTCSWPDFRTHADAIRKATPLRKVRTDMPDDERRKCWTFNPPHAETFLRHPDYKGIEFELMSQEGGTLVTFNIPVRNPRHFFVMRAE